MVTAVTVVTVATTATAANPVSDMLRKALLLARSVFLCIFARLMCMMMKRVILSLVALAAALSVAAQVRPHNNHTVSTTLGLGLEYGFEWAFAGQATVIGRIGYASKEFYLRNRLDSFQWSTTMAPSVTLEPRYYFLMNWREEHGKHTSGNSAEFFSVPATATLHRNGMGLGEVAVSPVVGIRRAFARHWFHEFTAGADLLCYPTFLASPHVGYRIGFLF